MCKQIAVETDEYRNKVMTYTHSVDCGHFRNHAN